MPRLGPIRRNDLIAYLRQLGFEGPYSGARHQYMVKGEVKLALPNPHRGEIGPGFLVRILRQAGIEREEWERL